MLIVHLDKTSLVAAVCTSMEFNCDERHRFIPCAAPPLTCACERSLSRRSKYDSIANTEGAADQNTHAENKYTK
jgi:hypothetical protein